MGKRYSRVAHRDFRADCLRLPHVGDTMNLGYVIYWVGAALVTLGAFMLAGISGVLIACGVSLIIFVIVQ